ncbi:MAG TPA: GNAT family N-acetyltransferase [Polyangia bacterium]
MDDLPTIAPARPEHLPALAAIELAAATLLEGHAPPSVLQSVIPSASLRLAQQEGRLWVALAGDLPVGFAFVEMLGPGRPHIEELDVHPQHGRRGLGTALVRAVLDWAARQQFAEVTLITFRAVPWNMPFYARLGFEPMAPHDVSPEIAAVARAEALRGLDPDKRIAMRFRVKPA